MSTGLLPLITVVVPVYNVEEYLPRCIESIIKQTYTRIEILLIDDGSTDLSGTICSQYEAKDCRIKTIHKANGGLSDARNTGIAAAQGEYIAFVDSDDFVHPNYLYAMYKELNKNSGDIVICKYIKGNKNTFPAGQSFIKHCPKTVSSKVALEKWHSKNKHYETVAWNKLYRTKLFIDNEIRYPIGHLNEDILTTHLLVSVSQNIVFINDTLYYYYQRESSITGKLSEKKISDNIFAQRQRLKWFMRNGYLASYERLFIKLQKFYMLTYVTVDAALYEKVGKYLYQQFCENLNAVLELKEIRLWEKIIFGFFRKYHTTVRAFMHFKRYCRKRY